MPHLRGYDISPSVKRKVEEKINDYPFLLKIITAASDINDEIDDEEYYFIPSPGYDRIVTSKTNTISRTTELQAIRISDMKASIRARERAERDHAEFVIGAIDRGIHRAARTSPRSDLRDGLRQDLFENMVGKKPRHLFDRDTKTFAKYRRRVFYYIADELGLLED